MKSFLTQWKTKKENQKMIDKVVDIKLIDEKPFNLVGLLRRKTNTLCVKLHLRGVGFERLRLKLE